MLAAIADNTTAVWDWAPQGRPFEAAWSSVANGTKPAPSTITASGRSWCTPPRPSRASSRPSPSAHASSTSASRTRWASSNRRPDSPRPRRHHVVRSAKAGPGHRPRIPPQRLRRPQENLNPTLSRARTRVFTRRERGFMRQSAPTFNDLRWARASGPLSGADPRGAGSGRGPHRRRRRPRRQRTEESSIERESAGGGPVAASRLEDESVRTGVGFDHAARAGGGAAGVDEDPVRALGAWRQRRDARPGVRERSAREVARSTRGVRRATLPGRAGRCRARCRWPPRPTRPRRASRGLPARPARPRRSPSRPKVAEAERDRVERPHTHRSIVLQGAARHSGPAAIRPW